MFMTHRSSYLCIATHARRYYNDLWELDLAELKWSCVGRPEGVQPSPRSGMGLLVSGDTLWLFGGYSKVTYHERACLSVCK